MVIGLDADSAATGGGELYSLQLEWGKWSAGWTPCGLRAILPARFHAPVALLGETASSDEALLRPVERPTMDGLAGRYSRDGYYYQC